jgi:hypothetical protein
MEAFSELDWEIGRVVSTEVEGSRSSLPGPKISSKRLKLCVLGVELGSGEQSKCSASWVNIIAPLTAEIAIFVLVAVVATVLFSDGYQIRG